MKKIVSLVLTLMLLASLTIPAFATGMDALPEDGTITINSVSKDTTYSIYRLLDLESFDKASGAYSYRFNTKWEEFFTTGAGKDYVTVNDAGYVSWSGSEDAAVVAAFAKLALAYAKENDIAAEASHTIPEDYAGTSHVFNNLKLGWYLVDTTAGALCGLTTTDKNASINAKNGTPTVDKQVQEDLDSSWGDTNTADIGQIVNFQTIIQVAPGAENFVLHDKMSSGLTFVHDPNVNRGVTLIEHINSLGVKTNLVEGNHYTVKTNDITDGCTFAVVLKSEYVATLSPNDRILIYYNAMLNRHAVVGGEGNINESWLEYGEEHYTTHDQTKTYTFSIDIVKTDSSNNLIDGAKFKIYDAAVGGNEIAVVPLKDANDENLVKDANGNPMYRRARADETGVEIEVVNGKITVVGFDNGVYYLEETVAPAGYNKLTARQEFTIANGNLEATFNAGIYSTGSGVHVVNKTGSMLPETGAMGTMMFITFGFVVMLGTGVLLVTKKRMSMIQE